VHRYSNFLRGSRFPVISTKHRNASNYSHAYESSILRGRTVVYLDTMNPREYSENSDESCWLRYIAPWLNVHLHVGKIPKIMKETARVWQFKRCLPCGFKA